MAPTFLILIVAALVAPPSPAVKPLFTKYCQACHGPTKAKGGIRFDKLDFDIVRGKDGEHWQGVLANLQKGEMPPDEKPQPTGAERRTLISWIASGLDQSARLKQAEAASLLRRLTREQYTNTLRDLLGIDSDYTRLLPPESPSKMGMQNDGSVLASSTLHLEQTMMIARVALDRALSIGPPPPAWRFRYVFGPQKTQPAKKVDLGYQEQSLPPDQYLVETFADRGRLNTPTLTPKGHLRDRCYVDLRGSQDYDARNSPLRYSVDERGILLMPAKPHVEHKAQIWQGPNPNLALVLRDFPSEGAFVLRVTVSRASAQGEVPWLRAFVGNRLDDGMEYGTFDQPRRVDAAPGKPQVIEFGGRLENLPIPVADPEDKEFLSNLMVIGVWNDVLVTKAERTSPALVIRSIEFEGPITVDWPSATHRRVFFNDELSSDPETYARQILQRFLVRAFRRPPTEAQLQRHFAFWQQQVNSGVGFAEAIRDSLAAALSSPSFLHHVEESQRLDDHALASRLAYFLWNTMPDEELLVLASQGQVRPNLVDQTKRLLADPRARAFFQSYATQWLDLGSLDRVHVDVELQPGYTRFVKEDMRLETSRYLEHLFTNNRPLTEIVTADYTMLNQNLAQFYGIAGVTGPEFRSVKLPDDSRGGGLLTQGSFLVGHSTGDDSHPIKRGVWLAKKILDDPPPPPPPNVPEIDRENPEIAKLSVKAQLEIHRNKESCRDCHKKLDPWGIPFENFDAAGLWRAEITKKIDGKSFKSPVDAATKLVDGHKVNGLDELKTYLLGSRRDQLRRSAARHLVAYALGRTPSFIDDQAVKDICAQAQASGDGLQDLILAVVQSRVFQSK